MMCNASRYVDSADVEGPVVMTAAHMHVRLSIEQAKHVVSIDQAIQPLERMRLRPMVHRHNDRSRSAGSKTLYGCQLLGSNATESTEERRSIFVARVERHNDRIAEVDGFGNAHDGIEMRRVVIARDGCDPGLPVVAQHSRELAELFWPAGFGKVAGQKQMARSG